jgi:hypothetical protein
MANSSWPSATRDVGVWALNVLERELGKSWPEDAYQRTGAVPSIVMMGPTHAQVYGELIELALRLQLLGKRPRFVAVRNGLRRDHRDAWRLHSRVQLEVAGLALQEGLAVAFEPTGQSGAPPADLSLVGPAGPMLIEARVLLKDDVARAADAFWDVLFFRLLALEATHNVKVSGELLAPLEGAQLDSWLAAIETAASEVVKDGCERAVNSLAGGVVVWPRAAAAGKTFRGPAVVSPGWPRTAAVLRQKAEQAARQGSGWLRLDMMDGLWQLTPWAHLPLAMKVEVMAAEVRRELQPYSHLAGVVLTSGACLTMGGHEEETYRDHEGNAGLRLLIAPVRVRETVIVPLDARAQRQSDLWVRLYNREPGWIDWALSTAGLPPACEVLAEWVRGSG